MEQKYNMTLPKGSGDKVDIVAQTFVERYGFERLGEIAKLHFKNTEIFLYFFIYIVKIFHR